MKFTEHRKDDHNPWNYVCYLTHIKEKNKSDLNGTESYVLKKWKADDISWFPIGKAGALKESDGEDDVNIEHIFEVFLDMLEKGKNLKEIFEDEDGDVREGMLV